MLFSGAWGKQGLIDFPLPQRGKHTAFQVGDFRKLNTMQQGRN
jgi:hypothetical protein